MHVSQREKGIIVYVMRKKNYEHVMNVMMHNYNQDVHFDENDDEGSMRRTYCFERSKLGLVVKDVKPGVLVQAVVKLIV